MHLLIPTDFIKIIFLKKCSLRPTGTQPNLGYFDDPWPWVMRDGDSFCFERWTRSTSFERKQLLSFNFREKKKPVHCMRPVNSSPNKLHNKE
jgi:hypothetical protein